MSGGDGGGGGGEITQILMNAQGQDKNIRDIYTLQL